MNIFFLSYTILWVTLCIISSVLYFLNRKTIALSNKQYWLFLIKPWKLVTFFFAAGAMVAVAPYSGDSTWDYYDAAFMSILTFAFAPWAIAVFYKSYKNRTWIKQTFIAFCTMMFSASWSYDLYIYLRDKNYPLTWWPNIILSSILFICAGLLWNLDWNQERGAYFAFIEDSWPEKSKGIVFPKIFIKALPYMLVVALLCGLIIYGLKNRELITTKRLVMPILHLIFCDDLHNL